MDITGLDKAEVLAALFNAARPQGKGLLKYDPKPMSADEARKLSPNAGYVDYLQGRVMKIDISGDEVDTWLYNRDNGEGAAETAIMSLRSGEGPDNEATARIHEHGLTNVIQELVGDPEEEG